MIMTLAKVARTMGVGQLLNSVVRTIKVGRPSPRQLRAALITDVRTESLVIYSILTSTFTFQVPLIYSFYHLPIQPSVILLIQAGRPPK